MLVAILPLQNPPPFQENFIKKWPEWCKTSKIYKISDQQISSQKHLNSNEDLFLETHLIFKKSGRGLARKAV